MRARAGFTLIEIMAVVLIIGLMFSGVSANIGRVLPGTATDSAASQLLGDIDLARSSAIAAGRPYEMRIDFDAQEYRIYPPYDENGRIARDSEDRFPLSRKRLPAGVRLDGMLAPDGETVLSQGQHSIIFPADGVMLDIVLYLVNEVEEYYNATIHVGGLTGRSEVVEGHQGLHSVTENDF